MVHFCNKIVLELSMHVGTKCHMGPLCAHINICLIVQNAKLNVFLNDFFLQEGKGIGIYGVWGILQLILLFYQNCYLFILTERQHIFYIMALDMVFVYIMQDREYLMNQFLIIPK